MSKGLTMSLKQVSSFGAWLSHRRKAKGMTQQQLADALGVKQPVLSRIENGLQAEITEDQAEIIARTLQVELAEVQEAAGLEYLYPMKSEKIVPIYVKDSSGRRWEVLSGAPQISDEVAAVLATLGVIREAPEAIE